MSQPSPRIRPSASPPNSPQGDRTEEDAPSSEGVLDFRVCPVCGGELVEIRMKRQCARCHAIIETCCEGGRE
jgi:hypothetical protein